MSESGDKTEDPTPKRLRDARNKGQVAKSKEVPSALVIVFAMLFLWGASDFYLEQLDRLLNLPIWIEGITFQAAFTDLAWEAFRLGLTMALPVVGVAFLGAFIGNFIQVGVLIAVESVKPDLKKLNPASAIKNMVSKKNIVELLKSLFKVAFMTYLVGHVIWVNLGTLLAIPHCGIDCILPILGSVVSDVIVYASLAFILVAAADYAFQKFEYIKELRMTKDEVKREFKESEGSPEIKGRRRQLFMEIVNSQQASNVKRSSVIVSNPTHVAVGLYYDREKTPLPIVTLKARGIHALRVIDIAEREGVPVMQNVPLAHSLHDDSDLDSYIPESLIVPVAEVLRVIQHM